MDQRFYSENFMKTILDMRLLSSIFTNDISSLLIIQVSESKDMKLCYLIK